MDIEKLLKAGKDLGYEQVELREWVERQTQVETLRLKEERERIREEKERIKEEKERIKEEKERNKEQQLLVSKQLELEKMKIENPGSVPQDVSAVLAPSNRSQPVKSPRLPFFDDAKDYIDSYLLRFERYAGVNNWKKDDWAIHLSALLRGKALDVYSRLNDEEAVDYDIVKTALLKRYNLTENGFLDRFRKSRPENGERMSQFKTRLASYLDKWISLSNKKKDDSEDLYDLFMMEQLMNSCNRELMVFLKERKPKTADELVEMAEKYVEAHGVSHAFSIKGQQNAFKPDKANMQNQSNREDSRNKNVHIKCNRCHKFGHIARDCRTKMQLSAIQTGLISCRYCHRKGHSIDKCWEKQRKEAQSSSHMAALVQDHNTCDNHITNKLECGCPIPVLSAACSGQHPPSRTKMPVSKGLLNGIAVTVLRDSGCSGVVVKKELVDPVPNKTKSVGVTLADGRTVATASTEAHLDCPYYAGKVEALLMDSPLYDVILGNISGVKCPGIPISDEYLVEEAMATETRSACEKKVKSLLTAPASGTSITVNDLIAKQGTDETLKSCHRLAEAGEIKHAGSDNTWQYIYHKGVLFRHFQSAKVNNGDVIKQVVLPQELRQEVMKIGHESILGGHLAVKKTTEKILNNFFWPNVWQDVRRFCRSCDKCQRTSPKGATKKVPLSKVPVIDEPFSRIAVDLVGPIIPASDCGNRYILTVVDYCTRYPEAIPLKTIDTERVAEALVDIFTRTGIPHEILSDRGSQFTSDLMAEICRLLSMKQLTTTPYHPMANGAVERFNFTLKTMLKRLASDRPKDWDRYINAALFAYREAPQESLGFSPFELLFGRTVRGPMTILRELWTKDIVDEEVKTTYQYVVDLREKMENTIALAHQNLAKSSERYKMYYDKKAKPRNFQEGDKVLLLLPTKRNKLELKWQGPFEVVNSKGCNNYTVDIGSSQKTYHANLLKKYYVREIPTEKVGLLECAVSAVIGEDDDEEAHNMPVVEPKIELPCLKQTETYRDVEINTEISQPQKKEVVTLLREYQDVLTDVPGKTNMYTYDIKVNSQTPIRRKPYPVPQAMKATLHEEVKGMLDAGIIEPSDSPYCSPSVVVKKKDGSNRYCVDYRALNNITVFDAEPMPRIDDLFQQIGKECAYVTKIDLSKGYWQIPLSEQSKPLTAFATELGLMQFKVMPFGLQCAPAVFSRLMRKVLHGLVNVQNYIDDIIIHNSIWEDHLQNIKTVLQRLRESGITARPSKCHIGLPEVEFLGHKIGSGKLSPTLDKIEAIRDARPPENKKQLRSFLGLASFYRRYVPNFSTIVSPLTDATRKGMPNRIIWGEPQKKAFEKIKEVLTSEPVLRLPDFDMPFILSTDASDTGVGAILAQEYDDGKFPVAYISRKLLPREQRYSVVEKECLALVWAVKSLETYLLGREFTVETDHAPLLYLNRAKSENGRLMRWSLVLHQYRFNLRAVKGRDNHGPDFLSRLS